MLSRFRTVGVFLLSLPALVAAGPATKPVAPASQPAATQPAKAKPAVYNIGQKLEVKWHGLWRPVSVLNKRGDWYLVEYEQGKWKEWAEPWRLRTVGSTYDIEGMNQANPYLTKKMEGPPREKPGDPPEPNGPWANRPKPGAVVGNAPARGDSFAAPDTGFPVTEVKKTPPVLSVEAPSGPWKVQIGGLPSASKLPATLPAPKLPGLPWAGRWAEPRISGTNAMVASFAASGLEIYSKVLRIDLPTGTVSAFDLNPASAALDLSPSGKLALCRANGFFNTSRIDLYRLDAKPEHVISFSPFGKDGNIEDAFWLDEQNAIVVSSGKLSSWNVATASGNWMLPINRSQKIARSPDGKVLAAGSGQFGVLLIRAADGKVLGSLDGPFDAQMAFSDDGLRLVASNGWTLKIWDLQTGQMDDEVTFVGNAVFGKPIAVSKDYLLIGPVLYYAPKRAFVWQYPQDSMVSSGGRVFAIGSGQDKSMLASAVLPHAKALAAAQQATRPTPILRPGVAITLDLQIDADDAKREKIIAGITKQLAKSGYKVADGQPIRLVARTEDGPSQTREYRRLGPGGGGTETVTITPKLTKLILEMDGQSAPLWQTSRMAGGDPGSFVTLKEGESIQDLANRNSTPTFDWMTSVALPTTLIPTTDARNLPTSAWGPGGVVDKK